MSQQRIIVRLGNVDNELFKLALSIYVILSYMFNNSITYIPTMLGGGADNYQTIGIVIIAALLILKVFQHLEKADLIKLFILLLLAVTSFITSGTIFMLVFLLFLMAGKNVDVDEVIKADFFIKIFCVALVIGLSKAGIIYNYIQFKNGSQVSALGFKNINILSASIFEIALMYLYLKRDRINMVRTGLFFCLGLINYYMTESRTPFYTAIIVTIVLCFYVLFKRYIETIRNFLGKGVITGVIIGFTILSFVLAFYLDFLDNRGDLFSYRLSLVYSFVKQYGITLFGQHILTVAGRTLDVGYIYILLAYGVVGIILFLFAYIKALQFWLKEDDVVPIIVIFAFLLYGMGETILFRIEFNFSLLLIIPALWMGHNQEKD